MNGIGREMQSYCSFPLFDSHFHIIDRRFPLTTNNGYLPEDMICTDYRARMAQYDLRGGALNLQRDGCMNWPDGMLNFMSIHGNWLGCLIRLHPFRLSALII